MSVSEIWWRISRTNFKHILILSDLQVICLYDLNLLNLYFQVCLVQLIHLFYCFYVLFRVPFTFEVLPWFLLRLLFIGTFMYVSLSFLGLKHLINLFWFNHLHFEWGLYISVFCKLKVIDWKWHRTPSITQTKQIWQLLHVNQGKCNNVDVQILTWLSNGLHQCKWLIQIG